MKKYCAMLLCLCTLALLGCAANNRTNDAAGTASTLDSGNTVTAQYIRTNGYNEGVSYPIITVIRSADELQAYYEANKGLYDLESHEQLSSDTTVGFPDATEKYDDAYFHNSALIVILVEEGSGSIRHEVTSVNTENDSTVVQVNRISPEVQTTDMAEWHILIEAAADIPDHVTVQFTDIQE